MPNVGVVMRYNGRVVPTEVIAMMATYQGAIASSGPDGRIIFEHMPPGLYELWPVGSVAELRRLTNGVGPEAPVRMTAAPGENLAELTFEPVSKP